MGKVDERHTPRSGQGFFSFFREVLEYTEREGKTYNQIFIDDDKPEGDSIFDESETSVGTSVARASKPIAIDVAFLRAITKLLNEEFDHMYGQIIIGEMRFILSIKAHQECLYIVGDEFSKERKITSDDIGSGCVPYVMVEQSYNNLIANLLNDFEELAPLPQEVLGVISVNYEEEEHAMLRAMLASKPYRKKTIKIEEPEHGVIELARDNVERQAEVILGLLQFHKVTEIDQKLYIDWDKAETDNRLDIYITEEALRELRQKENWRSPGVGGPTV